MSLTGTGALMALAGSALTDLEPSARARLLEPEVFHKSLQGLRLLLPDPDPVEAASGTRHGCHSVPGIFRDPANASTGLFSVCFCSAL